MRVCVLTAVVRIDDGQAGRLWLWEPVSWPTFTVQGVTTLQTPPTIYILYFILDVVLPVAKGFLSWTGLIGAKNYSEIQFEVDVKKKSST